MFVRSMTHESMIYTERTKTVYKNLIRYRSKNNFVESSK